MSRELFNGQEILNTGRGQCVHCSKIIVRVLVEDEDGRTWHTAEIGGKGYVPHFCGPTVGACLKRAA